MTRLRSSLGLGIRGYLKATTSWLGGPGQVVSLYSPDFSLLQKGLRDCSESYPLQALVGRAYLEPWPQPLVLIAQQGLTAMGSGGSQLLHLWCRYQWPTGKEKSSACRLTAVATGQSWALALPLSQDVHLLCWDMMFSPQEGSWPSGVQWQDGWSEWGAGPWCFAALVPPHSAQLIRGVLVTQSQEAPPITHHQEPPLGFQDRPARSG